MSGAETRADAMQSCGRWCASGMGAGATEGARATDFWRGLVAERDRSKSAYQKCFRNHTRFVHLTSFSLFLICFKMVLKNINTPPDGESKRNLLK